MPTPDLTNSLEGEEDMIDKSEMTSQHKADLRYKESTESEDKIIEEDYIPLEDTCTVSKHTSNRTADEETQLCEAHSAQEIQQRCSRKEAEAQLVRQAKIKREMSRARKAANESQKCCTFSLLDSDNDALIKDLNIPNYATKLVCPSEQDIIDQGVTCFPGRVTIHPHLEAMEYALDEYNGRRKTPGRRALWVDGSLSTRGVSGTAVVFRADPRKVGSKWTARAYTVLEFDRLGTIHTEALAIMHALRIALAKAIDNDGTDAQASDVVIFSDCMSALQRIESFRREIQCWGKPLLGRIATLANELRNLNVKVELRWVPAHKSIPGNYLADVLAKRASRRKLQEQRFLSSGRG